jgi:hypothetical protein
MRYRHPLLAALAVAAAAGCGKDAAEPPTAPTAPPAAPALFEDGGDYAFYLWSNPDPPCGPPLVLPDGRALTPTGLHNGIVTLHVDGRAWVGRSKRGDERFTLRMVFQDRASDGTWPLSGTLEGRSANAYPASNVPQMLDASAAGGLGAAMVSGVARETRPGSDPLIEATATGELAYRPYKDAAFTCRSARFFVSRATEPLPFGSHAPTALPQP